ncbi:YraN family protein [Microcella alkalica]|uniref:YraN family protein n=1 Tax=Microcella alkalica TaxID=355930 RepID=UPI00145DA6A5|nr:YraN family protein [Microcella alkalica]
MARKDVLGRTGEQLAVDHLIDQGFEIIERNWRCRDGEIDIVAREGRTTVVVEVKTRGGTAYGHPLEAITPVKLARLRRLAGAWCAAHGPVTALRIDAIAVVAGRAGIEIEHVRQVA